MTSLSTAVKAMLQLGPVPLALNLLYRVSIRLGRYKRSEHKAIESKLIGAGDNRLFNLPDQQVLGNLLAGEDKVRLLEAADEIMHEKIRLFGGRACPLQLGIEGQLKHWTDYELHPKLVRELSYDGDIKFLWEPARFGWAYTLGRAYHLEQDDKYALSFWRYFERFLKGNPAYLGPHWMNGQEAALRLMALVWSLHVFDKAPSTTAERRATLLESIYRHAQRIPPTLLYARSQNNNHLVTEAAGLYTAGLLFKEEDWCRSAWRWLNWCFQNQISGYGEYIQHSTNYHRLVLQTALWVDSIKDRPWPHASMQGLERATHFLFSMLDPYAGRVPNLGANDGALIFPLSSSDYGDFRPTVQAAARAFLNAQMPSGPWDEMSLWLALDPVPETYGPEHYMGENLRGKDTWGYLRASRFKSRLGHMDQLHLDLWWRGLNIAQDAGTYLYNASAPWDNPLVSTRVHNTVSVDGRDQMTRAGRFLTLDWFPAWSKTLFESNPEILQRVLGYHKGYRGVRHDREITVYIRDRWVIEDRLRSASVHSYRLHWLLPDWEMVVHDARPEISLKTPHGLVRLVLTTEPAEAVCEFSLVRAGELISGRRDVQPYEGWVSPTYGVKIPALSLALEVRSVKSFTFRTEFTFHPQG